MHSIHKNNGICTDSGTNPFPYWIIDHFFSPDILGNIVSYIPDLSQWWQYDNPLEKKWAKNRDLPMPVERFILDMQSHYFVDYLEKLTGIQGLITDHTLNGGGLHQILPGGKLDIHEDYNYHPITRLDRRLNVLLYLNLDWKPEYGGNLELWDKDMTKCVWSIVPWFNRMVIFETIPQAYHGHPEPLQCPTDMARKSIAMYYYTNGRPESEIRNAHSTLFQKRPQDPENADLDALRLKRSKGRLIDA